MPTDSAKRQLGDEVAQAFRRVLPEAEFIDVPAMAGPEGVAVTAAVPYEAGETRALAGQLVASLRELGWQPGAATDGEEGMVHFRAGRPGVGDGYFTVKSPGLSFQGQVAAAEPAPEPASEAWRPQDRATRQREVSRELRRAIKAGAGPGTVHPEDEFGDDGSVRIAGWDPDRTPDSERLIERSRAHLERHGWTVTPDMWTDSSDRSARLERPGFGVAGRLTASGGALTFTGEVAY